ncbi:MAG: hypothetical protein Kow0081_4310 [Candidatus Dojkabacteria bacterium]
MKNYIRHYETVQNYLVKINQKHIIGGVFYGKYEVGISFFNLVKQSIEASVKTVVLLPSYGTLLNIIAEVAKIVVGQKLVIIHDRKNEGHNYAIDFAKEFAATLLGEEP